MFYQHTPAGNPVRLSRGAGDAAVFTQLISPYSARCYASGTAALAAALLAAKTIKPVEQPEVILPAYGCPDLVSAAVYAGVRPVLADFLEDRPWLDAAALEKRLTSQTIAIVAVNLFGLSEQIEQLQCLARQAEVLLIEDSAQAFPGGGERPFWQADLVVLSFGRGKPVSLLGGGAVLYKENSFAGLLPSPVSHPHNRVAQGFKFWLKTSLYNLMLRPRLYWLPNTMPFLHLGETRFHPLETLAAMDPILTRLLPGNLRQYQADSLSTQHQLAKIFKAFDHLPQETLIDLPAACGVTPARPLLRYPILVDASKRDQLVNALQRSGLGVSKMYPATLPAIQGLEQILDAIPDDYPVAKDFANRLLTLPTHRRVRQQDIKKIQKIVQDVLI